MTFVQSRAIQTALAVSLAIALAVSPTLPAAQAAAAPRLLSEQRHVVPAYFPPSNSRWVKMCQRLSLNPAPSTVVMNPASGPGDAADARYWDAIATCHSLEQRVIGYVTTDYTAVSLDIVKNQIDAYYSFYPEIDGIFLDRMGDSPDQGTEYRYDAKTLMVRDYYRQIRDHIRSKAWAPAWSASTFRLPLKNYIVGNTGTGESTPWPLATPVVDNLVVFEGTMKSYRKWVAPEWVWDYPATKITQFVYGATPYQLGPMSFRVANDLSRQRNAGFVYITEDSLPNPWDTLTANWPRKMAIPPKHICCMRMQ